MKRPLTIILAVVGIAAAALALCLAFGALLSGGTVQQAALNTPTATATAAPTMELAAMAEPTATSTPEPEPIPTPEPLGIEKQALTFAEFAPTTTMSFEELVGDNGIYENAAQIPPLPSSDTYKIVVNEYWQFATVYAKDKIGEYTIPVRYMIVTTGASGSPTPKGTFIMGVRFVRFGRFDEFSVYGQYWREIRGPFYFHSLLYARRDADSYNGSYSRLGRRGSHGCVRLTVPDARWIYYNIAPGTTCEIIRGDRNDEEAAAIKAQLVIADSPGRRPRLSPGGVTVTEAWPGWQGNAYDAYQEYLASQEALG